MEKGLYIKGFCWEEEMGKLARPIGGGIVEVMILWS